MKRYLITFLCLGALVVGGIALFSPKEAKNTASEPEVSAQSADVSAQSLSRTAEPSADTLLLQVEQGDEIRQMPLGDYLVGVLLAEMPTDFPMEALKAQTVASRTFALRQAQSDKHTWAHICTDAACCQGWADPEDFDREAVERAQEAVSQTDGLVLTYDGQLIEATFFSCSGGQTEAAVAVWGTEVPYLQSVSSPGEEDAPRYTEQVSVSASEFAKMLQDAYPQANLSGTPEAWFGSVSYTSGGGIDTVFIGGVAVQGTALRRLFSLRSTDISVETTREQVIFTTCGFGHRVGLSQYGARAMAESGCDFSQILAHYYQNTQIKKLLPQMEKQLLKYEDQLKAAV